MLTPLQISTQRFTPNGKGGYKASEVDAFVQKIYKYYNKLYNDNNALNDKLQSIAPVIEEYNKNKSVIANVLISAQSVADSKLEAANAAVEQLLIEAEKKAEQAYNEKVAEAENYYTQRTGEAEQKLDELERNYNRLKADSDYFKNKYLVEIKAKVDEMIIAANEKAASIVSAAFEDAKSARVRADLIIDEANVELKKLYEEASKIKSDLASVIGLAAQVSEKIVDFAPLEKVDAASEVEAFEPITSDDLPAFDFAVAADEEQTKTVNDVFSVSEPQSINVDEVDEEAVSFNQDEFEDIKSYTNFDKYEIFEEDVQQEESSFEDSEPVSLEDVEEVDIFSASAQNESRKEDIPDMNSYISKIFDSLSTEDEVDSFGFGDLISESNDA